MDTGYGLLSQIGSKFLVSLVFGFAALKIRDFFLTAVAQHSRFKIWWALTSAVFLLFMILFLSTK